MTDTKKTNFNLLITFLNATYSSLELNILLNLIMDLLTQIFKSEVGIIFTKNEKTGNLRPIVTWGLEVKTLKQLLNKKTNQDIFQIFIKNRQPFFLNKTDITENYIFKSEKQLNNLIGAPLIKNNELMGSIFLGNKIDLLDNPLDYNDDDLTLFNVFSGQIANALSNALLYNNVVKLKNYNAQIINAVPLGLLILDKNKNIKFANQQITNLFSYTSEELLQKPYTIFLDESLGPLFDNNQYIKNKEITIVDKNNNSKIAILSMVATNNTETNEQEYIIMLQDITEEKELEKQVERSKHLSSMGIMAAEIAHELKNPLAAIKGYTDLIPMKKNDPAYLDKYVKIVNEEMDRLTDTIKMLLTFARGKSEKMKEIELIPVLNKVQTLIQHQAKEANVNIETKYNSQPKIFADARQLEQVFLNITQNGIQAMPEGGTLTMETVETKKNIPHSQNSLFVEVNIGDTGSGIKQENIEKIFTPFFTTKEDGNGLGLPICFKIIQEHGGTITVNSTENVGTTFAIYLPILQS